MSIERQLERPLWYLLPSAALFGVVTLFPLAWVAWLSLHRHSFVQAQSGFVGAGNYLRMAGDVRFWNALGNTIYFTGFSVALELVLGLIIALMLHRATRGRGALYAIVLIPWVVPTAVSTAPARPSAGCGNGVAVKPRRYGAMLPVAASAYVGPGR